LEYKPESVIIVGADLPVYRMIMILLSYLFVSHNDSKSEDEAKLARPKMHFARSILTVLIYLSLGVVLSVIVSNIAIEWGGIYLPLFSPIFFYGLCVFIKRRSIVIWVIRFYQFRAPANVRVKCVLLPSCSDYMILAIGKYGLVKGIRKGIDRLRWCGPPVQVDYP
jgi:putative component of membrane protein insertase Oxa1/YidC/SpoIIIJ protein YidD